MIYPPLAARRAAAERKKRIDDATPDDPYIYIYLRIEFDE